MNLGQLIIYSKLGRMAPNLLEFLIAKEPQSFVAKKSHHEAL